MIIHPWLSDSRFLQPGSSYLGASDAVGLLSACDYNPHSSCNINDQNVSVKSIDINAISLYLSAGWVCFCSKLGMEVEYAKSNLKTPLSQMWVICQLLPFVREGQYSVHEPMNIVLCACAVKSLHNLYYTLSVKRNITSSGRRSLKSTLSKLIIFGHK